LTYISEGNEKEDSQKGEWKHGKWIGGTGVRRLPGVGKYFG